MKARPVDGSMTWLRPKSEIFTRGYSSSYGEEEISTFSGLMSQWMTPWLWIYCRASRMFSVHIFSFSSFLIGECFYWKLRHLSAYPKDFIGQVVAQVCVLHKQLVFIICLYVVVELNDVFVIHKGVDFTFSLGKFLLMLAFQLVLWDYFLYAELQNYWK